MGQAGTSAAAFLRATATCPRILRRHGRALTTTGSVVIRGGARGRVPAAATRTSRPSGDGRLAGCRFAVADVYRLNTPAGSILVTLKMADIAATMHMPMVSANSHSARPGVITTFKVVPLAAVTTA